MTRQEKLLYLLGYSLPFILDFKCQNKEQETRRGWLLKTIKDVVYFHKDIEYLED